MHLDLTVDSVNKINERKEKQKKSVSNYKILTLFERKERKK